MPCKDWSLLLGAESAAAAASEAADVSAGKMGVKDLLFSSCTGAEADSAVW